MWLTDTSVKRPVFATVLSLLLVAFGLVAFERLPLREYPDIDPPIVTVRTNYLGANAAVVESKVTRPIEERLTGIEGIKTVTSTSQDGLSTITIEFQLSRDIDGAANDVRDRIGQVLEDLPEESDPPEVQKADADDSPILWLNLVAENMTTLELSDYADRYLVDRFSSIDGVARVLVSGSLEYSMRVWLDRKALAARGLTVLDVEEALRAQNVELPAGTLKSVQRDFVVRVERGYIQAADFAKLVIQRGDGGYLVRLADVARVEVGPAERRRLFRGNGVNMVGLGIIRQSTANTLDVTRAVKAERDIVNGELPPGMEIRQSFDSSVFIESAINEVYTTLAIAAVLVVAVMFLFLGDIRAMLVPAVTVPVSLIATSIALLAFGYSINLLTLLAMVLAIGLVVDDSIVVLENVHRRLGEGESPLVAAYRGSRQVGFAVVATSAVLIGVFFPITFLEGNVGRLFGEFAIAMAAAVFFSTVVALTLSPALCSKLLSARSMEGRLSRFVEGLLARMQRSYGYLLRRALAQPRRMLLVLVGALIATALLFLRVPGEFTPREDRGVLLLAIHAPEGASFDYTRQQVLQIEQRLMPLVEKGEVERLLLRAPLGFGTGEIFNQAYSVIVLTDWAQRRPVWEIIDDVRRRTADLSGVRIFPIAPPGLGGRQVRPVQFVVGGGSYEELAQWRDILLKAALANRGLIGVDSDYKETKPQLRLDIDRDRSGDLGVSVLDISRTLESLLGSRRVTTFIHEGEEYDVVVEGIPDQHRSRADIDNVYVRSTRSGELIPLASLVESRELADAASLNRYNRLRSVTIEAGLAPGYTLGEALDFLDRAAAEQLPASATIDYKGESLEFRESGRQIYFVFALSLLVVYLVLAAQFESFIHPFIIILTVPLAVAGALLGLWLCGETLNIYSQIAIIMLVGLAAKNGILIVEFANQLRDEGVPFDEALVRAAELRLRPVVMTSITTVMGAIPLMLAFGAGSEARFVIGVVVVFGVVLATLLTLLVVPATYLLLARNTSSPLAVSRRLERELTQQQETAAGE